MQALMSSSPSANADADNADGKSIVSFLKTLGRQPDDMLRLFNRKDHYCMQGRDADTVAVEYFKSTACIKYWGSGDQKHPYLTMNKKMGTEVIRTALLQKRRRVEIYCLEKTQWILERRGSPGNLQAFEEECQNRGMDLDADTSPVIVAVRLGKTAGSKGYSGNQTLVGVAFVDCTVRGQSYSCPDTCGELQQQIQRTDNCL